MALAANLFTCLVDRRLRFDGYEAPPFVLVLGRFVISAVNGCDSSSGWPKVISFSVSCRMLIILGAALVLLRRVPASGKRGFIRPDVTKEPVPGDLGDKGVAPAIVLLRLRLGLGRLTKAKYCSK